MPRCWGAFRSVAFSLFVKSSFGTNNLVFLVGTNTQLPVAATTALYACKSAGVARSRLREEKNEPESPVVEESADMADAFAPQ